jgi:hypothetical protein
VGMFMVNSWLSSIKVWMWRWGARLTATKAGLLLVGIAHATVVVLGLPVLPIAETRTVCIGCKSRYAYW